MIFETSKLYNLTKDILNDGYNFTDVSYCEADEDGPESLSFYGVDQPEDFYFDTLDALPKPENWELDRQHGTIYHKPELSEKNLCEISEGLYLACRCLLANRDARGHLTKDEIESYNNYRRIMKSLSPYLHHIGFDLPDDLPNIPA